MNWSYANNKKIVIASGVITFCSMFSSHAMMQRIKNLLVKQKKEELNLQQKFEHGVVSNLQQHAQLARQLKSYGKSVIIGGLIGGYAAGYILQHALKPVSSVQASLALSLLLAAGQKIGLYDWSNSSVIKKIMNHIGTTATELGIIAISLPASWLAYEHLSLAVAALGALSGYYVYKN